MLKKIRLLSTMKLACSRNAPRSARLALNVVANSAQPKRRLRRWPSDSSAATSLDARQHRARAGTCWRAARSRPRSSRAVSRRLGCRCRIESERHAARPVQQRRERRCERERAQPVRIQRERHEQAAEQEDRLLPDPVDRAAVDQPERRQADQRAAKDREHARQHPERQRQPAGRARRAAARRSTRMRSRAAATPSTIRLSASSPARFRQLAARRTRSAA